MAELRRRRRSAIRDEIAAGLRVRAKRYGEGGSVVYARLGEMLVSRAEQIVAGTGRVVVYGWELPDGALEPGHNPSNPLVLHPDDRLTAF